MDGVEQVHERYVETMRSLHHATSRAAGLREAEGLLDPLGGGVPPVPSEGVRKADDKEQHAMQEYRKARDAYCELLA